MALRTLIAVAILATSTLGCSWFVRTHPQKTGHYEVRLTQLESDACGQFSQLPTVNGELSVGEGDLVVAGNTVRLFLTRYDVEMQGLYNQDTSTEQFFLDGSIGNRPYSVLGTNCQVQLVSVSITAETQDPDTFTGNFSLSFDTQGSDVCTCESSALFRADFIGP